MERLTDLRFIIGLFFTVIGMLLLLTALFTHTAVSFGHELNLYAGGVMALFGVVMLVGAVRRGS